MLKDRIEHFWGYGSLESPVWLVGIEERFDPSQNLEMLEGQFNYAEDNAVNGILDASRSKRDEWKHLANMEPFLQNGKLQSTWKYPIALYLYLCSNTSLTTLYEREKEIGGYQREVLADTDAKGATTLELSPLPCPGIGEENWVYKDFNIVGFSSRKEYEKKYLLKRTETLKEFVKEHKPKLIIFYGMGYLQYWEKIIGEMPQIITRRTKFSSNRDTAFCVIPNGGQSGLSYDELYEYANLIKNMVKI